MAYVVKAQPRSEAGKSKVRRLRRAGMIPAVIYGHGDPSTMLTLSAHDFGRLLDEIRGHSPIVEVEVENQPPQKCVIKTIQRNPIDGSLLHVDFQKVHLQEKITMAVPVILHGTPIGVKQGGMLDFVLRQVSVRATIDRIPEHFDIDISNLRIGQSYHIADLGRADLEFVMPPESAIVTILSPRKLAETPTAAAAAAAAEAAPAEPEVIKEKKPTEEGAGEEETKGKGAKPGKEEKKEK